MIVDVIKEIAVASAENAIGADILLGRIKKLSPLQVAFSGPMTLDETELLVLKNATQGLLVGDSVVILTVKNNYLLLGGV